MSLDIKNLFEETAVKSINLKGKMEAAFGSYGWSGEAPRLILAMMKKQVSNATIDPSLIVKY